MSIASILWVDDEIEVLEPHKRFLEMKGYALKTFTNSGNSNEPLEHFFKLLKHSSV